jgi:hypothetical protein
MESIDLEKYRTASDRSLIPQLPSHPAARRQKVSTLRFLRGPIPMPWLQRVGRLPKSAITLGIALWHHVGLNKAVAQVKVTKRVRDGMGLSRRQAQAGVHQLADAGLIRICKGGEGRCTVVELVLSPDERRLCEDGFRRGRVAADTSGN